MTDSPKALIAEFRKKNEDWGLSLSEGRALADLAEKALAVVEAAQEICEPTYLSEQVSERLRALRAALKKGGF